MGGQSDGSQTENASLVGESDHLKRFYPMASHEQTPNEAPPPDSYSVGGGVYTQHQGEGMVQTAYNSPLRCVMCV